ncbi:unnamed protein product [Pleuronectes platessa]|uniref:Uncharacterized protein n=1 Tax=Pleuronectes platessa TaxID=8262 RepID=A0A9N7W1P1_PLEPL|nr:unnamed protein product [Pleuronectes platessa]
MRPPSETDTGRIDVNVFCLCDCSLSFSVFHDLKISTDRRQMATEEETEWVRGKEGREEVGENGGWRQKDGEEERRRGGEEGGNDSLNVSALGSQRSPAKQGTPHIPLLSHDFQLFLADPDAFPGQIRYVNLQRKPHVPAPGHHLPADEVKPERRSRVASGALLSS